MRFVTYAHALLLLVQGSYVVVRHSESCMTEMILTGSGRDGGHTHSPSLSGTVAHGM